MPDKDRIIELLDSYGVGGNYAYDLCDKIEECYADELADAEKWKRVERAYNSSPPCDCPEWDGDKAECMIEAAHCPFNDVVAALEGESEGEKG